ncbi:terminal nucleotidyltransferase 4B-like [Impatiens glandulifera]|uniref:terminal nucleotidyltransferase 4B-like n=1 Tax=Impatiens glandulifera TaxID=253017 RepID=UPI001FB14493|nr:terminal nucleotidyltransferase 4B-like [Impatiens glandulifera]
MEAEFKSQFLYDTLSPITAADPAAGESPSCNIESKPYVVFRNEISLSTPCAPSNEIEATDFFSLDVAADDDDEEEDLVITPLPSAVNHKSAKDTVEENTLEGNWFRGNCRFKSPMLQLHKEILDFCDFLSPTQEEQEQRKASIDRVFEVIKYIWPNSKGEVFGSFRTGLYLPSSDIDLVILESEIKTPRLGLQALARALTQKGIAKKIQVIAKARVPIIKFIEKKSGISFDLSFDLENGPKAADFIKEAVTKWPPLRPLCLILKVFLQQRELNEVYTGGIGSYALLAMLIAMLRNMNHRRASPELNLGVLLVHFFDFYGRKLNISDVGVSCNGKGTFFVKSSKGFLIDGRPFSLCLEDPQAPENDIGKSSFNYFQVRSAFSMAFSTLTNVKTIIGLGSNRSILGTIIRPDSVLLERKGGSNGSVTFKELLPGAGEPLQDQYDDKQDIYCNWNVGNDDEIPLPRGNGHVTTPLKSPSSSGKKREASSKVKKKSKKLKLQKEEKSSRKEEGSSSKKGKDSEKKRWRKYGKPGSQGGKGGSGSHHGW